MPTTTLLPSDELTHVAEIDRCLAALERCQEACGRCADAWLSCSPLGSEALRCIRLILDCSDLCAAAADLLPHVQEANPVVLRSHLGACALACDRAVREAERAGSPQAQDCVETCRRTARICRETIPLLPTVAAAAA